VVKLDTEDVLWHARWLLEREILLADRQDPLGSQPEGPDRDLRLRAQAQLLGSVMPDDVRQYLIRLAMQPPRGRASRRNRDKLLVSAIRDLCDLFFLYELKPTRNRTKHGLRKDLSGCGAVAIALAELGKAIDESTVEKIWEARTKK
jgi:hypothetical protein